MTPETRAPQLNANWSWMGLNLLVGFWGLCALIVILSGFYQRDFFNPEIVVPFYGVVAVTSFFMAYLVVRYEDLKNDLRVWWCLYILNSFLVSGLMMKVHWSQSMFFLMHLVNIISSGLTLRSRGSLFIGLISLVGYNFSILVSPQTKVLSVLFTLIVNNVSLVLVATLSGQLSEYLETLGVRLHAMTRDLKRLKNLHELVLAHIPSGVLTIANNQELIQGNDKALEILGPQIQQDENQWRAFLSVMTKRTTNALGQSEIVWVDTNGRKKVILCQLQPISLEELDERAEVLVLEDVTELREMEDVLKNQEKLAAVGKLAAGIAHEIRNPLASISGSVQLLSTQAGTDEDKKLFNIVIRETDRLNLLITEFLDYAKPLPPPTEAVLLPSLVAEVLELLGFNNKLRKDVEVIREIQSQLLILGYKDKLKQALLNILINAFQAMDKTENPKIFISLKKDLDNICLRIRDTGPGMKEEIRSRIFEPFFTTKSQGTGLGLAVTHKIFEGHGASIIVESQVGIGTEFVIKFKEYAKLP